VFVLIAGAAVGVADTRAVPAAEGCTAKPGGLAPPGQHWYYAVDHADRHCWYLGAAGIAVRKGATSQPGHRASPAPAAAPPAAQAPATQPPAPVANALGWPMPPERAGDTQVFDRVPPPEPAPQWPARREAGPTEVIAPAPTLTPALAPALAPASASKPAEGPAASETGSADAVIALAPTPTPPLALVPASASKPAEGPAASASGSADAAIAPATEPAEAPAATARPAEAAVDGNDHAVALVVLAAALLVIVGAVAGAGGMFGVMQWRSWLKAAAPAEIPHPPQVRRVRASAPTAPAATESAEPGPPEAPEPAIDEIAQTLRRMLDETPPRPQLAPALPAKRRSGQSSPQGR
jgi:hypothetical protein